VGLVSIKTIAEHAGVTHGTVSRALRNDPRVKPETIARITALARELGYRPSRIARGLKLRRTGTLGLVVANITDPFLTEVIRGVHDAVLPAGYSLFVAATDADVTRATAIIHALDEHRVDGLLLLLADLPPAYTDIVRAQRMPSVLINNHHGLTDVASVSNDDRRGITELVQHLVNLGHRRVGYLGDVRSGATNALRQHTMRDALAQHGLTQRPEDLILASGSLPDAGYLALFERLRQPGPTAWLCFNDLLAIGALRAAKTSGIHVPTELSIVGFDDIALAHYVDPPLTTFAQPTYDLGHRAGALMMGMLATPGEPALTLTLSGTLVARESTAAPQPVQETWDGTR
jgi:DNA-binding LacI/PurR family transcriptional regulator